MFDQNLYKEYIIQNSTNILLINIYIYIYIFQYIINISIYFQYKSIFFLIMLTYRMED